MINRLQIVDVLNFIAFTSSNQGDSKYFTILVGHKEVNFHGQIGQILTLKVTIHCNITRYIYPITPVVVKRLDCNRSHMELFSCVLICIHILQTLTPEEMGPFSDYLTHLLISKHLRRNYHKLCVF